MVCDCFLVVVDVFEVAVGDCWIFRGDSKWSYVIPSFSNHGKNIRWKVVELRNFNIPLPSPGIWIFEDLIVQIQVLLGQSSVEMSYPIIGSVRQMPLLTLEQWIMSSAHTFIGKGCETGHAADCSYTRKLGIHIVHSRDINKIKGKTVTSHFDKSSDVKSFHLKFHKTD